MINWNNAKPVLVIFVFVVLLIAAEFGTDTKKEEKEDGNRTEDDNVR